ncbi:MAG: type I pullulanase [Acholeplasma sp.]|nr:type I pullulanase [Acholeplasma sp.]
MFRKIITIVLLFVVSFTTINQLKAATESDVYIHYFRYDGAYDDWDAWIWKENGTGVAYIPETEEIEGKNWGTFKLPFETFETTESTRFGFIIRTRGSWDAQREPGGDRFITTGEGELIGNDYHFYVLQSDTTVYTVKPETYHKILTASFKNENTIAISTTVDVSTDNIKVFKGDVEASITSVTGSKSLYTINTENADLTFQYTVSIVFGDNGASPATKSVGFDGIYGSDYFNEAYGYEGNDLGVTYTTKSSTFKLWAPVSDEITLNIYDAGHPTSVKADGDDTAMTYPLVSGEKGVWSVKVDGNLHGKYYTYTVKNGTTEFEVVDPYAVSSGVNALRGAILDLNETDPDNWNKLTLPYFSGNYVDAILYELHVRDLTSHSSWNGNPDFVGKFMGIGQSGTSYTDGDITVSTGLDHMKELGITHLHLLPAFEFGYIDETKLDDSDYFNINDGGFNWGYMPTLFNVPEGSYSTNPYDASVRVNEFKQMVSSLANNNIRTVMDVVYNHTGDANYNFNKIVPNYYFRLNDGGSLSNGSGTGNETASEHFMMRKFMIDSVLYWAKEYNVKGFRFDLMALHDSVTMKALTDALHEYDPTIIVYGEPWTGGTTPLSLEQQATKQNMDDMPNVAAFNDVIRNAIRGNNNGEGKGWVQGNNASKTDVLGGIQGTNGFGYTNVSPNQTVNYVSAHDNSTLADQIALTANKPEAVRKYMQTQSNAIVFTSQGIPFIHAGAEFMRSKPDESMDNGYNHNSYNASDLVNQINYTYKVKYHDVFESYKQLIKLRSEHASFKLNTYDEVDAVVSIIETNKDGVIAYRLVNEKDLYPDMIVIHSNVSTSMFSLPLPQGNNELNNDGELVWQIAYSNYGEKTFNKDKINVGENVNVSANESIVLYYGMNTDNTITIPNPDTNGLSTSQIVLIASLSTVVVIGAIGAFVFINMKKKNV